MLNFYSRLLSLFAVGTLATAAGAQTLLASNGSDAATAPEGTGVARTMSPLAMHPLSMSVADGVLTVDGFTAKLKIAQEIRNAGYVAVFIPGTGTVVVSLAPTPDSKLIPAAFHGNTLSFTASGRDFVLASDGPMIAGGAAVDAYMRLDTATAELSGQPQISFGAPETVDAPGPVATSTVMTPRAAVRHTGV